jgi:hypothetical protein
MREVIPKISSGASGDILTLWDSQIWEKEVSFYANHCILTILKHKDSIFKISLIKIYIPNRYLDMIECWSSLFAIKDSLDMENVVMGGYLNTHMHQ